MSNHQNQSNNQNPEDCRTFLDKLAAGIITLVVIVLLVCVFVSLVSIKTTNYNSPINFKLDSVHINQVDTTFIIANRNFISSLNQKMDSLKLETTKLAEVKVDIENAQKKNEDYFKLILALVGSVFAIVGFFGFKSISDTRQATLDAAKIKAETVAENSAKLKAESTVKAYLQEDGEKILKASATKTATEVAKETAKEVSYDTSTKTATEIAQEEVRKYFADQNEFRKASRQDIDSLEKEYNILRSRIIELEEKIFGSETGDLDQPVTPQDNGNPEV